MEKMIVHSFTVKFTEADSKRFEAFLRETGMKKLAVARKGILKYIEDNQPNSGN